MNNITTIQKSNNNLGLLKIFCIFSFIFANIYEVLNLNIVLVEQSYIIVRFFCYFGAIATLLFFITEFWNLVDKKINSGNIINIYGQYWFYFLILPLIGGNFNFRYFLPYSFYFNNIICTYLSVLAIIPFLQKILTINKNTIKSLIILLFFLIIIPVNIHLIDSRFTSFIYFSYLFICVGYFKKYLYNKIKFSPYFSLILGLFLYFILLYFNKYNILNDYKSIGSVIISLGIFYYFSKLTIKSNKIINFLSKPIFCIIIVTNLKVLMTKILLVIFKLPKFITSKYFLILLVGVAISIYIGCYFTDSIRSFVVRKTLFKIRYIRLLYINIKRFYRNIYKQIGL